MEVINSGQSELGEFRERAPASPGNREDRQLFVCIMGLQIECCFAVEFPSWEYRAAAHSHRWRSIRSPSLEARRHYRPG